MAVLCNRICWTTTREKITSLDGFTLWKKQGSFVWTMPETAIKWMGESRLSSSKESALWTMWCEGVVHCGKQHSQGLLHHPVQQRQMANDVSYRYWNFLEHHFCPADKVLAISNNELQCNHNNARCHTDNTMTNFLHCWDTGISAILTRRACVTIISSPK